MDEITSRFLSVCRAVIANIYRIDLDQLLKVIEELEAIIPKENLNDSD